MADVSLAIKPLDLANLLTNAVEISKEAARIEAPAAILLAYQPSPDGKVGQLYSYGCGRYAAGRTRATLDGLPSSEAMSVSITREHAEELASALRKTSRAAEVRVGLMMTEVAVERVNPETGGASWGNLAVSYKDDYLAVLHDADPHGRFENIWSRVDDLAANAGDPIAGVTLMVGVLNRIQKIKGAGDVADLRTTPLPGVIAAKLGADCVLLLGEVNKQSFSRGGRYGDGLGKPVHLWAATTTS
jgi:hypothetical protein